MNPWKNKQSHAVIDVLGAVAVAMLFGILLVSGCDNGEGKTSIIPPQADTAVVDTVPDSLKIASLRLSELVATSR